MLYFTPASIGYLTQLILASAIAVYFLFAARPRPRPRHIVCLTAFFVIITAFIFTLFLEAAFSPTLPLYAVTLQVPLLSAAWVCLLQFAYHFPDPAPALRREARLTLFVSGLYALWETGYAGFRFLRLHAGMVEYRPDWSDYFLLLFLLWPPAVFVRRMYLLTAPEERFWARLTAAWRRPASQEARALRLFTLIFLFVAVLGLFNLLRTFYWLSVPLANACISPGTLVALFAFAVAYLNYRPELTSFMVKLAGVTLTTMLAILGVVGWAISPAYTAQYAPDWPAERTLRFTPDGRGGYDVTAIPLTFERAAGENLHLDDSLQRGCSAPIDFNFPFYGQIYHAVYACNDGVIGLGQPVRYREFQYRYGGGAPLLAPLAMDLYPTISPSGVFARQEPGRLVVTWERLRGFRRPQAEFTFQAILYADGVFDFSYAALPARLTFSPNDDPGASLWFIGALPGGLRAPAPRVASLRDLPLHSGPEGVIQDFNLEFRRHVNRLLAPLTGLILAASVCILVGFPFLFRYTWPPQCAVARRTARRGGRLYHPDAGAFPGRDRFPDGRVQ